MNEELKTLVTIMHNQYTKLDDLEDQINYIKGLKKFNLHNPINCAKEMKNILMQKWEAEKHIGECLDALKS